MRIWIVAFLLLLPASVQAVADISMERPNALETVTYPPDLTPRSCSGLLGIEQFIPIQYIHVDGVPVVLLAGSLSGDVRVSWSALQTPDHGAVWAQGTAMMDTEQASRCGIFVGALPTDGVRVRLLGLTESRVPGNYEVSLDGQRFTVSTGSSVQVLDPARRHHWEDDAGKWNFGPYFHEALLGARIQVEPPSCDLDNYRHCTPVTLKRVPTSGDS